MHYAIHNRLQTALGNQPKMPACDFGNDFTDLQTIFNALTTELWVSDVWHRLNAARWCLHAITRGIARWHACESRDDHKKLKKITKYLVDNKKLLPIQNLETLKGVYDAVCRLHSSDCAPIENIKEHLIHWKDKEEHFLEKLRIIKTKLFELQEHTLSGLLQPLIHEVEDELFNVLKLIDRLCATNYDPKDIGIVMRIIHKYFEHEYESCADINFDI